MTGRFFEWVNAFLEKRPLDISCDNLSMAVAPYLMSVTTSRELTNIISMTNFDNYLRLT